MWRRSAQALLVMVAACSRHAPTATSVDGAAPHAGDAPGAAPVALAGPTAIFSAPIAGARVASGEAIAVGLVVATRSITAARVDATGHAAWTRAVVSDVKWSQDAELHAFPIAGGALVVWRGPVAGKSVHVAVAVAPDGHVIDGPFDVGSFVCATDDGVAWSEPDANGTRVKLRTWGAGGAHDVSGPALADDFTLTCGDHRAYVVVEGDEGAASRVYVVGDPSVTAPVTIAPTMLGRDEERDLFAWAEGDESGVVRIAQSGAVTAADIHGGALSVLHAEGARLPPEDDVVSIDADTHMVSVIATHDESDRCPEGRGGSSIHALRIARQEASKATSLVLAPSACEHDVGPFWTNRLGASVVVGWAERASRADKTSAPITGLAFHALDDGAKLARIALSADAIADAGCDASRCEAVALVREPGMTAMTPEAIKVVAYP